MRFFKGAGGLRLAGDVWGDPGARPIVLSHGAGQSRHSWQESGASLAARGYHVISLDLRGHGDSEWSPDGDYSIGRFADDLRAVLETLSQPPVLVGASVGGLASLIAAGDSPTTIACGLVLVDIVPTIDRAASQRIVAFMKAKPEGFESLEEAAELVAAYVGRRPGASGMSGLAKNLRKGPDGRYRWHWDARLLDDPDGKALTEIRFRTLSAARKVRTPTLLVRGANSDMVTDEGVAELRSTIAKVDYVVVQGATHMVAGDDNNAFNAAVIGFLERVFPTTPR